MDSQILLNVNFCSEVHTNLIEKNEKSVYVRAGYSLGGLRIVPQENAGICVICMDGHIKRVYPGELEAAVCIEESCELPYLWSRILDLAGRLWIPKICVCLKNC